MRWTRLFIPTLRDNPAGIEDLGYQLLLRAGYIRAAAPGIYSYMFLGERSLQKITQIVREQMQGLGAQEIGLPALHPTASVITSIAQGELRSHRQLPQIWHHIQTRVDEQKHSRADLLRARQSLVSESYSFDIDAPARDVSYQKHCQAFSEIFERCGINCLLACTPSGCRFVVPSGTGGHSIIRCTACNYASDVEHAAGRAVAPSTDDPPGDLSPELFQTPGRKTIADVADFTGLPETSQMKSLVLVAAGKPILALVRGDHSLNEAKFARAMNVTEFRPAQAEEIRAWFGADAGSLGPVGVENMRIIADEALQGRRNMIAGANRNDYHLRHVTPGQHFAPEYFDLRQASAGDGCLHCGGALKLVRSIEIGHLAKLDLDLELSAGSYSIYLDRLLSASIELHHDKDGMALPAAIAPFDVVITPVSVADSAQCAAAGEMYEDCRKLDLDVLLDDRDERPGVKFKDADLIGIPYRLTLGKKLAEGVVEVVERATKNRDDVATEHAAAFIAGKIRT